MTPGIPTAAVALMALVPASILLVALGLMLRLRAAALRAGEADSAAVWFSFCHRVQWLSLAAWAAWIVAIQALQSHLLVPAWFGPLHPLALSAIGIVLALMPPAALTIAFAALSYAVASRMRGIEWTLRQTLGQAVLQLAAFLVPVGCMILTLATISLDVRWGLVIALLGVVALFVFTHLHQRSLDLAPHAVTTGPLRDRVFALAKSAGVTIRQLYVLPMARSRLANAFAVQGETVMLTDYLLTHLGRREVDTVLAHEVTHLRHRHPLVLTLTLAAGVGVPLLALMGAGASSWLGALPLAVAIGMVAVTMVSRRLERTADAGMVDLTRDPEAAIAALVGLGRINQMPLDWGRVSGRLMTHPSTRRRAQAIGARGGLPPERIEALLAGAGIDDGHYEVPPLQESGKVFSTRFKAGASARISWSLVGVFVLTPLLAVTVAGAWQPPPIGWLALAIAGFAGTLVFAFAALDLLPVSPYRPLAERLRERFVRAGLDPDREGGVFVGFAPDREPRVYEQFYDWDVGFLFPRGDRLVYVGEETRFALTRDQVRGIERILGAPGWIRSERLRIDWEDATTGRTGGFIVRPAEVGSMRESRAAARVFEARLAAWRLGGEGATTFAPGEGLTSPVLGEVTSLSPRAFVSARQVIGSFALIGLLSLLACVLVGMTGAWAAFAGLPYVVLVALATHLVVMLPILRWREGAPAPARPR